MVLNRRFSAAKPPRARGLVGARRKGWRCQDGKRCASAGGNRKGYAGYEFDSVVAYSIWHVRNRVLNSDLGRWTQRDPLAVRAAEIAADPHWSALAASALLTLAYDDGPNIIAFGRSNPGSGQDPLGLAWFPYPSDIPDCFPAALAVNLACCLPGWCGGCTAWACTPPAGWAPAPPVGPFLGTCFCTAGWCVNCTRTCPIAFCSTNCNNCSGGCLWTVGPVGGVCPPCGPVPCTLGGPPPTPGPAAPRPPALSLPCFL